MKQYFGFRYFSSDKTTAGKPHKQSGNVSIAGECIVFNSKQQLEEWLNQENLSTPSDSGGDQAIHLTRNKFSPSLKLYDKALLVLKGLAGLLEVIEF
jgi:hypothetical protein